MAELATTNLKNLRKDRRLGLTEAATAVGISAQKLWNYENGRAVPPAITLLELLDLYKADVSTVFQNSTGAVIST